MKQLLKIVIGFVWSFSLFTSTDVTAQDSATATPSIVLRYFVENNRMHYLVVQTRVKVGKKFLPVPAQVVEVYLDSNSKENLIARTVTDKRGESKIVIPPSLKDKWNNTPTHSFTAVSPAAAEELTTTIEITKARILIDTANVDSIRTVNVNVQFFQDNVWIPAPDVEMKVGVNRLGGILSGGEEATYTTDSTGTLSVEFNKDKLPGDVNGNFVLVARVEDNELYGNLLIEKIVPWGIALKPDQHFFDQRTLWSTRFKTPLWLLFMAYSIVIIVWGVIIYLVIVLLKIRKLGTDNKQISKDIPRETVLVNNPIT